MITSLVNAILYACVVAAAVSASAVVFLVAVEAREGMGMAGFLGSLLLFPVTWVAGPILMASGGNSTLMPLLALSLFVAAPPVLATWLARRGARRRGEEGQRAARTPADGPQTVGPHAPPSVVSAARAYPLAPPPPTPGAPPLPLHPAGPMPPPLPLHPPVYGPPAPVSAMAPPMRAPLGSPITPSAAG